jgi:putative acetyltransferase
MKINFRQVKKSDNRALVKVIKTVFEEHDAPKNGTVYSDPTTNNLYELFRAPRSVLWVAETHKKVVGCCGVYPIKGLYPNCAEIVKYYIYKEYRGIGIGKELMNKCIESASEMGYTQLYLESLAVFSVAVSYYEKLGFLRLDEPLGYSGHTTCDIWMLKKL